MALIPEETLKRIKVYRDYSLEAKTNEQGYQISMRGLEAAIAHFLNKYTSKQKIVQ